MLGFFRQVKNFCIHSKLILKSVGDSLSFHCSDLAMFWIVNVIEQQKHLCKIIE